MSMTIEDYIQKQRDITYLRLSREVQDVTIIHYLYIYIYIYYVFQLVFDE